MSEEITANRRAFLKSGALVAAPLAAVVPGAAIAMDVSAAKLARIEDERAIEALNRGVLKSFNGGNTASLGEGVISLAPNADSEAQIAVAPDGRRASSRQDCMARIAVETGGDSTVERMTRFQGHGSQIVGEHRVLVAEYVKNNGTWALDSLRFA